jgi:hypothetical protein
MSSWCQIPTTAVGLISFSIKQTAVHQWGRDVQEKHTQLKDGRKEIPELHFISHALLIFRVNVEPEGESDDP